MKVSLNWIKQLTEISLSDNELLECIGSRIGEIEDVQHLKGAYEGVVVAKISQKREHPDADKLGVYDIDAGSGKVQVVAGDKTLEVGDVAAYIAPGVQVPATCSEHEPYTVAKANLRGQDSNGMLASAKELMFGDDHEGVLKLDTDAKPGTPLVDVYELDDIIFEIENKALTHRPDCFGFIGLAREIAGIQQLQFKSPDWYVKATNELHVEANELQLSIQNDVPEQCPRYMAVAVRGVDVKPSPVKMQSYLSRIGLRPINNIVDTTNYLMVLSGQPIHAFDYDKVAERSGADGAAIVVRNPRRGEKLTLLDGKTIEPKDNDVLICTDKQLIAVGGAMGGAETEVNNETKNIIIEVANFDLYSIRAVSMRHGIFSEAVTRYSRGQDPNQCQPVLARTAAMIKKVAGGTIASDAIDDYQDKKTTTEVKVTLGLINGLLGANFTQDRVVKTLDNVELDVETDKDHFKITAPTWRSDLHIPEDIAEEVGRLNGYDSLEVTLPKRNIAPAELPEREEYVQKIRRILADGGANEVLTYNFVPEELFAKSSQKKSRAYRIRNSISPELAYMRTSLMPSLLSKVYANIRDKYDRFAIFEINKVHDKTALEDDVPTEYMRTALVYAADAKAVALNHNGAEYYVARMYVDHLAKQLKFPVHYVRLDEAQNIPEWVEDLSKMVIPTRSAVAVSGDTVLGIVGEYNAHTRREFKVPEFSAGIELDTDAIIKVADKAVTYQPLSRYPKVEQDVTFVVKAEAKQDEVEQLVSKTLQEDQLHIRVELIDIYKRSTQSDKKHLTYHLELQHYERTLTTKEVNERVDKMVAAVERQFDAKRI